MRPALLMACALGLGIAAAGWVRPHPALALAGVVLSLAWAARSRQSTLVALLAAVAAFGCLRYAYVQTAGRGNVAAWEGRWVWVTATVVSEPEGLPSGAAAYVAMVEQVGEHPARGRVQVTQRAGERPGYGERIRVQGRLEAPPGSRRPGGFDRAAYLARQGVYLTLETREAVVTGPGRLDPFRRTAVTVRRRLEAVLRATLPQREAALMAGLLLGSRSALPEEIAQAFRESGVFHLLAVSGGNVAMVLVPFLGLLRQAGLRRRWAAALGMPLVAFFVLMTGAGPSVLRAGLMAELVLLGEILGRERDALNTLGAAVMILLAAAPGLLFDVGFQLSAGATLGILLFTRPVAAWLAPRLQRVFGPRAGSWMAAGLAVTFAAQAVVEPLSLHHFGTFSPVAPLANLLVALCQGPVVHLGSLSLLTGLLFLPLARLLNVLVQGGLWVLIFLVKATAAVPGGYLEVGRLPLPWVVGWYAALALVARPELADRLWALTRGARRHWAVGTPQIRPVALLGVGLSLGTLLTWHTLLAGPGDSLTVTFLDVGQGDAILVKAPGGHWMLVDAGPTVPPDPVRERPGWDAGAEVVVPHLRRLGVRYLERMVLTHADQDHAGGAAAVLQAVSVGSVLHNGLHHGETRYQQALAVARSLDIPMGEPAAGERFTLGAEVAVEVVNPPRQRRTAAPSDDNGNCVALRVSYRQVSFFLACDLEGEAEARLVADGAPLRANVLKVSHHGSGYSSTAAFLQAVRPDWAVISAGAGNPYGHPHAAALDRIRAAGAHLFRTDRHGAITFRTDGFTIWASGRRGGPEAEGSRPLGLLGRRWLLAW